MTFWLGWSSFWQFMHICCGNQLCVQLYPHWDISHMKINTLLAAPSICCQAFFNFCQPKTTITHNNLLLQSDEYSLFTFLSLVSADILRSMATILLLYVWPLYFNCRHHDPLTPSYVFALQIIGISLLMASRRTWYSASNSRAGTHKSEMSKNIILRHETHSC